MKKLLLFVLILLFPLSHSLAQIIETDPGIPTRDAPVIVYFNSDEAVGDLHNYSGDLYAHTGLIIEGETGWKYVIGTWGVNSSQPKFTYLGNYRYQLDIGPTLDDFYSGLEPGEKVKQIAMVIRTSSGNPKSADLFIDIYEAGLQVNITNPSGKFKIGEYNSGIDIAVAATGADSLSLYIDDKWIMKSADPASLSYTMNTDFYGGKWIKAVAYEALTPVADSVYCHVPNTPVVEDLPAGIEDGITYTSPGEATLVLTAPGKSAAYVIGDFNNWIPCEEGYMKITTDAKKFWIEISGLEAGKEYAYQYLVDDIVCGDPYSEKVLDPWNDMHITEETYPGLIEYPIGKTAGIVSVLQTEEEDYTWEISNFIPPEKKDLVVYELLVRDFIEAHDYSTLIDTLHYLDSLGVNAIELMPVNEFDNNLSWGYNPSYYFAPDKYYGSKNKLKEFIDSCHVRGIAVILDMVLNHATGSSPMAKLYWDAANNKTAADNPWFNVDATHDFNVFHDFNHDSEYTRYHAQRVMSHWIEEYKVDGYRFDLSKGFTQNNTLGNTAAWGNYDAARVALWKMYADHIWSIDSDFYVILEHFADNSEEKVLAEYGMMLWGNLNHSYRDLSKGASSDISWHSYKTRGWTVPNLVAYMESHDEERMVYTNLQEGAANSNSSYNIKDLNTALNRVILSGVLFFTVPGPKMIWQFGELGYDYNIEYNGRTGEKPIRWDYYEIEERKAIYDAFSDIIGLKKKHEVFGTDDFTIIQDGMIKIIQLEHSSMDAVVVGNTDVNNAIKSVPFTQTGKWYEYFSDDSTTVSGPSKSITLRPGDYKLYTTKKISTSVSTGIFKNPYINNDWFTVYPNPVRDMVNIRLDDNMYQHIEKLEILSSDGRLIYSDEDIACKGIDLSFVEKGLYLLKIKSGDKTGIKRIYKY